MDEVERSHELLDSRTVLIVFLLHCFTVEKNQNFFKNDARGFNLLNLNQDQI